MTKLKLSTIIDYTLSSIFLFLVFFCWIRFYTKNLISSTICAVLITTLIIILYTKLKRKKNEKQNITKQDKKNADFASLQLSFMTNTQVINYFKAILKTNYQISVYENFIIMDENTTNATLFIPMFFKESVSKTDISNIFALAKQFNCNKTIISANKFDNEAVVLSTKINNLQIFLWDHLNTYNNIIKNNKLPPKVVDTSVEKLTFKQIVMYALSRKRIKNYVLFGIILILSSFFVYHKIYYLISGSILLILCIVIMFLPQKQNNVPSK